MNFPINPKKLARRILRKIAYVSRIRKYETEETYKRIIPGEVVSGKFYDLIKIIAGRSDIESILEIGSSSGEGSTRALLEAAREHPNAYKQIHCLEISKERYQKLNSYLKDDSRFIPHLRSSIAIKDFPSFGEVKNFHSAKLSSFSDFHLDTVLSWYKKDLNYLSNNVELTRNSNNQSQLGGIDWIKLNYQIIDFDFVIIDGGEFTGFAEYQKVKGAKFIALDDVNNYKSYHAYQDLTQKSEYVILGQDLSERNGWAIFQRS